MSQRIHITGASGSGTTTLGRAIATDMAVPHFDTDDYYWMPTCPPFTSKRAPEERLRLIGEVFAPRSAWVLSGSLCGWGDALFGHFDLIVLLSTPASLRMQRLQQREAQRYGKTAIELGGARYEQHRLFLDWAAAYDRPGFAGRSLEQHEAWLQHAPCRVLRLDGAEPVAVLTHAVRTALYHRQSCRP